MPERPLCLSALLALSVLVGCSSDNRVVKGCHAVALDRLEQNGVDMAEVKEISYSRQWEGGGGNDRTMGRVGAVSLLPGRPHRRYDHLLLRQAGLHAR